MVGGGRDPAAYWLPQSRRWLQLGTILLTFFVHVCVWLYVTLEVIGLTLKEGSFNSSS